MITPGTEPIRMLAARVKSTLPPIQWAIPAAQSRIAAWKTSVPTTFFGARRKTAISRIAITVPEPAEVMPITKPVVAPITTAATLWRRSISKPSRSLTRLRRISARARVMIPTISRVPPSTA